MHRLFILTLTAATFLLPAADKYSGPRPPKADLPYLVHADNLVPTEAGVAPVVPGDVMTVTMQGVGRMQVAVRAAP